MIKESLTAQQFFTQCPEINNQKKEQIGTDSLFWAKDFFQKVMGKEGFSRMP